MKQHNVLFSGKTLGLVLALFVQLLLSQTVFAQKAQVTTVRQAGTTQLITAEQVNSGFVAPVTALSRIQLKIDEHFAAVKGGNGTLENEYKLDFYQALYSSIDNGNSIFNSLGIAVDKVRELYPTKVDRFTAAQLKEEARTLLAN